MSWALDVKHKSQQMRRDGASFGEITKALGIPKSTLFEWVKEIEKPNTLYHTDRNAWLMAIRQKATESIKNKRQNEINQIVREVQNEVSQWAFFTDINVQKSLLSILYWAEGQKLPERGAPVKFTNTDPRLVLLFVTLLKRCYGIDNSKLKIGLYLHWYHKTPEVVEYWKKLLGVEAYQFRKIFRKKRSKTKRFRKNFMGICFVTYQSVNLRQRIVHTAYEIQKRLIDEV